MGTANAITDVAGVRVGHTSVIQGNGKCVPGSGPARTGVTAIWPAAGQLIDSKVPAAVHVINGFGKSIGLMQIEELGSLETPILITNTLNVGLCTDALIQYLAFEQSWRFVSVNPVIMECNDSYLNDILGRHVKYDHVAHALKTAGRDGPREGSVGAGVGMSCYGCKGGIGTASRQIALGDSRYHVGGLVCANMGRREDLRVDGVAVGSHLALDGQSKHAQGGGRHSSEPDGDKPGSIIFLLATDAPLTSRQLRRLAVRATHGLARTGAVSSHGSGDVVLAWSTAYRIPARSSVPQSPVDRFWDDHLTQLFRAAGEAVEECILNAIWKAESVTGRDGNTRASLPLPRVRTIMKAANYAFA